MSEERYLFSEQKDREELDRLALQASIFDPRAIRHFETIGVAKGWRCLEVGAGTGSIAKWLLSRVGPTGRVVATDIDSARASQQRPGRRRSASRLKTRPKETS